MTEPTRKLPTTSAEDWNACYREARLPWDSGKPSAELRKLVDGGELRPCAAIELGCGTGTNAVYLAQLGFTVTAVDLAPRAIEMAQEKAAAGGVDVRFVVGDVTQLDDVAGPFDFVFDRGCYHCVRRAGLLDGFLATVARLTKPDARLLVLTGNADSPAELGPPKVKAAELTAEFEPLCRIERLAAFHFEDAFSAQGPLGWSCLLVRR